jgi:LmbE family N-acetylglucosaminyl deacetylase
MQFNIETAQIFIPDGTAEQVALVRTTHMAIGAHQDDLEIMAYDGILKCFQQEEKWFCGVVVTNGSGSPRDDLYKNFSDDEMQIVRRKEQKKAAVVGEYGSQVFLDYPSSSVKDGANQQPVQDMIKLLKATKPEIVYTHNLADKHDTHVGVTLKVISAIRSLPESKRPQKLLGCEVWRDLDWLVDTDKFTADISPHENLQAALLGVFDSQICGGKRYDLATMGRRRAHATFLESHATDVTVGMSIAMDLTPLIELPEPDVLKYTLSFVDRFKDDIQNRILRMMG